MKTTADAQIAAHIHVVDGDEADVVDVKFAADGLANRALQQFAHPFDVGGWAWLLHGQIIESLNREPI